MTRQTQNILYHLLPVVFWLLAIGGSISAYFLTSLRTELSPLTYFLPPFLVLVSATIIRHVQKHSDSSEQCFVMALLLGIAAYWLPTVVLLALPAWIYLYYRNVFSFRSLLASLIGFATIAIWIVVLNSVHFISYSVDFSLHLWGWLPTGLVFFAWLGTTIVQQILRVR